MLQTHYLTISIVLAMASLFIVLKRLDRRRTHVRRLVLVAVLIALCCLSRFLFAAVPYFKPMTALIILTGIYLGPETGFLCGALTALLTNIYFGQGPWTPFQMLALGILGALSAWLHAPLKKSRSLLVLWGLFAGIFYSFFMDIWTCLWAYDRFQLAGYLAALVSAIPVTISYMLSNALFLALLIKPFGTRIGRILLRYRL